MNIARRVVVSYRRVVVSYRRVVVSYRRAVVSYRRVVVCYPRFVFFNRDIIVTGFTPSMMYLYSALHGALVR